MTTRSAGSIRPPDRRPFVVVHGGAERYRYRNVLQALDAALTLSADFFEFDVRPTADGAIVVHHDDVIGQDALGAMGLVAAERAAAAAGYDLPRLDDVLRRAAGRLRLDVELKQTGIEHEVLAQLGSHGFASADFVVTSFDERALVAVRGIDSTVITGLLVYDVTGAEALRLFDGSGAAFLGPDHAILDDETLGAASRLRVPLVPWTVNDRSAMRRLFDSAAVVGLITDDPEAALAVRASRDLG